MAKTAMLHEVLAVESDLASTAEKIVTETIVTFTKKADRFQGSHRRLEMFSEDRKQEEAGAAESKEIVETVPSKLQYAAKTLAKYWNAVAQKERTNQDARADIVVEGKVLVADMPATFLLGMETRLKKLRAILEAAPTHHPGIKWVEDLDKGKDIFRSETPQATKREEKDFEFRVLYDATEQHPAQIEKWNTNKAVGTYFTNFWTSTISPAQKSVLLSRCDTLIRAVKKARMRANKTPIVKVSPAQQMINFVLDGTVEG